ncbi:MAG: (d)CMP kinase [Deltaproteobacteria bacterium]|jgi:cytidylate kinase|nr:(d)CMP kinase [Deltaproteobacteria bacterium]
MSDKTLVITLDGPAGVGKSTLARSLARGLGLAFLDTGAMFRCVACQLGETALELADSALAARLEKLEFSLVRPPSGSGDWELACNGRVPGREIRGEAVGRLASRLAVRGPVREFLKLAQQELGRAYSLVAEGRDMGSVVFASACCKFFLDADPAVRARRRWLQLREQGVGGTDLPSPEEIERQIRERDQQDRSRTLAPLRPAEDAVIVDTSDLGLEQVLERLLAAARRKMAACR